jgi:ClpP class serine protease
MSRLVSIFLAVFVSAATWAAGPSVRLVRFDTDINTASARRVTDAIDAADAAGDALLLVELDTPGGSVDATETIVKKLLAAKTPTAIWVGPSGARAASGGFYLLIAADVAAMAPGTRTGAAAVIFGMGKSEDGDILLKKATNDLAALARSIAEHRGRNVEACDKAVVSAESFTDAAAQKAGLIDLVAKDRDDLLRQLDGRKVTRFDGKVTTLALANATLVDPVRTQAAQIEERLGGFLANPTVVYLLFLIGLAGLYAEFNHPGTWVPGLVGAVALILFVFSAQQLPISAVRARAQDRLARVARLGRHDGRHHGVFDALPRGPARPQASAARRPPGQPDVGGAVLHGHAPRGQGAPDSAGDGRRGVARGDRGDRAGVPARGHDFRARRLVEGVRGVRFRPGRIAGTRRARPGSHRRRRAR